MQIRGPWVAVVGRIWDAPPAGAPAGELSRWVGAESESWGSKRLGRRGRWPGLRVLGRAWDGLACRGKFGGKVGVDKPSRGGGRFGSRLSATQAVPKVSRTRTLACRSLPWTDGYCQAMVGVVVTRDDALPRDGCLETRTRAGPLMNRISEALSIMVF